MRPDFPVALGRMTGLLRLTLDVASFSPAAGGALPAALSRMTALQSLQLLGDWRHTVRSQIQTLTPALLVHVSSSHSSAPVTSCEARGLADGRSLLSIVKI
jgi:hypothetical protein